MDQSKSNDEKAKDSEGHAIPLPKRSFSTEFIVGLFTMIGVGALGLQAIGLGGLELGSGDKYTVFAEFDNVSGLKHGAAVEIAGVQIGDVSDITLKDPEAILELRINNSVQIRDADIASIRTKGIIGDRYVKISRGASDIFVGPGETITETESVVDIEDIIGKLVHSFSGDDEDEELDDEDEL